MPRSQMDPVLRFVRKLAAPKDTVNLADRDLLERFRNRNDQAAFATLVRRHGPMVLRLCLRVAQNEQDAEDAFQATFLVFSRQARSLRPSQSLGGWLYTVAYRIAQKARVATARRRKYEGRKADKPVADPLSQLTLRDAHAVLDRELSRLPDKFRIPLVLCYLEGLTRDEAAQQLGWPTQTLKTRLEQARERLRGRLASRGLALSGALVASLFAEATAWAAIPSSLLDATVKSAVLVAAGRPAASVTSAKVARLTQGALRAMVVNQFKVVAVVLVVIGLGMVGMVLAAQETLAARPGGTAKQGQLRAAASPALTLVPAPPEKYTFVDLQPRANQKLKDNFGSGRDGNDLASLRTGARTLASVNFKIGEGVIQLGSKFLKEERPAKVEGIKVGKTFAKLHILHATGYGRGNSDEGQEGEPSFIKDGTTIAEYVIRYEDGKTETIPVVYGQDVRDWWCTENSKGVTRGKVAWKGDNELAKGFDIQIRLYLTTWENPHPGKKVASIDYVKTGDSVAAPFCVAITLEAK